MSDATRAVFLSYASQDAEAAKRICETLRAAGIVVWFDRSELTGGDAWDRKIRGQIASCTLFLPVISAATQARREGYSRIEWKLAAQRTHAMADGTPFVLPVVIDATKDADALVPDEFRAVQWTRLPGGETSGAFGERVKTLLGWSEAVGGASRPDVLPESRPEAAPTAKSSARSRFVPAIIAFVAIVALALWQPWKSKAPPVRSAPIAVSASEPKQAPTAPLAADAKSIAVLAFDNLSSDKEQEYFSDGLSDNILDKLAGIPGLRVTARTSSFSFKGKNVPVQQIGRELQVGSVIGGSVQRLGSRLRITAQLINATDGLQLWSETYTKDLTAADIFAIQDEIALKIATKLRLSGAVVVATSQPTQNMAAYEAYLRGRSVEAKGFSQLRRQAVPYFEEAVRLDPGFTLVWARLAYALAWIHWANGIITGDELDRAQQALAAAMRLQPDLPEVHLARAAILKADGVNLGEADRELVLAEIKQPTNPDIIYERALVARFSGRLQDALALSYRAAERDPYNANNSNTAGIILRMLGRYPEALAAFAQSAKLSSGPTLNFNPYLNRAATILRADGDATRALRELAALPLEQLDADYRARVAALQNAGEFHAEALAKINAIEQTSFLSQWAFHIRALLAGRTREMMGDVAAAQRDYTEALPLAIAYRNQNPQSWRAYSGVALAAAALSQKDEALAAARKALILVPPEENPVYAAVATLPVLVEVLARFGMIDEALVIVREQIAAGWWRRNDLLFLQDYFIIRKDPRFRALAEKAPL
ncbi:MAG: TIR domain-containing protein [Opitutus sp.]|nr:TIR domain-containing protein [Opitutus sp.]